MLVETINTVHEHGGDTCTLRLYGHEVDLTTAAIARMNLFLHEIEDVGGVPPAGSGDYAWAQHTVASMNPDTGRIGAAMPHGVLFRGGAESRIRGALLTADKLDAVIGLPSNTSAQKGHVGHVDPAVAAHHQTGPSAGVDLELVPDSDSGQQGLGHVPGPTLDPAPPRAQPWPRGDPHRG